MALAPNALCTLEDVRVRIPDIASMTAAQSGSFEYLINEASDFAETYCNRTFLLGFIESEVFNGLGFDDVLSYAHTSYTLKHAPITTSPHTPKLYLWDGDSWDLVSNDSFTYDATDGTIYFAGSSDYESSSAEPGQLGGSGYYFSRGKNNYKVEYYYGYDGVANVPTDLRGAVASYAIYLYRSNELLGTVSHSSQDGRTSTYKDTIPARILRILDKYKR